MINSGIDWLEKIPKGWTTYRNKSLFKNASIKNHGDSKVLSLYRELGVIPKDSRDDNYNVTSLDTDSYKYVEIGDLVINKMKAWSGSLGVSDYEGIVSPAYYVCKVDYSKVTPRFIHHYLRNSGIVEAYEKLSAGMRIGQWDLGIDDFLSVEIAIPKQEEQKRIAHTIDNKSKQIDSLIANEEAQIEKLKEYKQSFVTEVVTKGLDSNALMKDSGILFYGRVPSHWKLIATKYLYQIESGATPRSENPNYFDGNIPWITPADYKTDDIFVSGGRRNLTELGLNSCSATLIPKGSIIFSKRAPIGSVAINSELLCTNQGCLSCIPKTTDLPMYYYYVMSAMTEQYNLLGSGTTFKEISANNFANFILPQPSIQEQKQIVSVLDEECSKVDKLIVIKQKKIEKLYNYKKSLIYEYVTGKREVL